MNMVRIDSVYLLLKRKKSLVSTRDIHISSYLSVVPNSNVCLRTSNFVIKQSMLQSVNWIPYLLSLHVHKALHSRNAKFLKVCQSMCPLVLM